MRSILHADLDAFYASVAQRDDPALRGKPVVVGGGVVLAASYEARAYGIRSAMGGRERARRCPHAIVVDTDWAAYLAASKAVFAIFERVALTVERISIDEAFLDVTGLERISGTPAEIAERLRREVRAEVGLPISVGVAATKAVAKVASNAAKPDGLRVVPPGEEPAFLWPLPVEALWGVGAATSRKLHAAGITRVEELAALPDTRLMELVGVAHGRHLHAVAHGRDPRPVDRTRRRRSYGAQSARRYADAAAVDTALMALTDRVTRRMRTAGRVGRTVTLRLRFGDYTRATRAKTLPRATAATEPVLSALRELHAAALPLIEAKGLTLVGMSVSGVESDEGIAQLELPLDGPAPALDRVLDDVRSRFGSAAVQRATLLRAGEGLAPTLLSIDEHHAEETLR